VCFLVSCISHLWVESCHGEGGVKVWGGAEFLETMMGEGGASGFLVVGLIMIGTVTEAMFVGVRRNHRIFIVGVDRLQ
jgi:hypothetical protein